MRLAILTSHPIQYYAPIFRELARHNDVKVFFAHQPTPEQQAAAGFDTRFAWDIDLLDGYDHAFLPNVAADPGVMRFAGCDTPGISAALDEGRFGALLLTGWHFKCYWQGMFAAKRRGLRLLVRGDSHLDTPRSTARRLAKAVTYPAFLRVFDAALYVGSRNRAYYDHYHYPAERLFFSPHCVDTERFARGATGEARQALRQRLDIGARDRVVLFAGKLVPFKRPLDVVEAVHVMNSEGVAARVMVAGSGPLEAAMKARAASLAVPLDILGFQNQTEMPAAYAAADVMALPSDGRETWGLVCNEALACGTPIVVSDQVGCAPDLAADQSVGRTFPVGNVAALADALGKAITSPPSPALISAVSSRSSVKAAADGVIEACARFAG